MDWWGEDGIASFLGEIYGDSVQQNADFVEVCESIEQDSLEEQAANETSEPYTLLDVTITLVVPVPTRLWKVEE